MIVTAIVLGIISVTALSVWAYALFHMAKERKPDFKKVKTEIKEVRTTVSPTGLDKEFVYEKSEGYEMEMSAGMTYGEIEDGLKERDPGAVQFVMIFAGFGVGLLSGIAAIGAAVVARGNTDGWFMIGVSCVFFLLFVYIVLNQRREKRKAEKSQ